MSAQGVFRHVGGDVTVSKASIPKITILYSIVYMMNFDAVIKMVVRSCPHDIIVSLLDTITLGGTTLPEIVTTYENQIHA